MITKIRYSPSEGQQLYTVGNQLKAEIDVYLTHERVQHEIDPPSIEQYRHAALHIKNKKQNGQDGHGYVVYDRLLNRIVDGVYYGNNALENALDVTRYYNEGYGKPDGSPNGLALGLIYPE